MKEYKFSLVLCTVGRTDCIEDFMRALSNQNYKNFELIIVDQNSDQRIVDVIHNHKDFYEIKHVKSEKGLSKSRNVGLKYIKGDIVAFPDDDCIYPPDLLEKINSCFVENNYDVLSIKMTNSVLEGRKIQHNTKSQSVEKNNVIGLMASISAFFRKPVIDSVGEFDERLGLGADTIFQGGEDYDYPLRALKKGFKIYYTNSIEVFHPWDDKDIDMKKDLKSRSYNGGAAEIFLLNKHDFSSIFKFKRIIRRVLIIFYYTFKLNKYKAVLSFEILKGMIDHLNYDTK